MKAFIIHRRDGSVVGIVTSRQEDAPTLLAVGIPDEIVTEVDLSDDAIAVSGPASEQQALEMLRTFRMEHRLVRGVGEAGGA